MPKDREGRRRKIKETKDSLAHKWRQRLRKVWGTCSLCSSKWWKGSLLMLVSSHSPFNHLIKKVLIWWHFNIGRHPHLSCPPLPMSIFIPSCGTLLPIFLGVILEYVCSYQVYQIENAHSNFASPSQTRYINWCNCSSKFPIARISYYWKH
jgi:hypothetical protein